MALWNGKTSICTAPALVLVLMSISVSLHYQDAVEARKMSAGEKCSSARTAMHASGYSKSKIFETASCLMLLLLQVARADILDDIEQCDSCHGIDGTSTESDVPSITGVSPFIIEEYMFEYRDNAGPCRESEFRAGETERPATDMCAVAKELSEDEIAEIAEFYAARRS